MTTRGFRTTIFVCLLGMVAASVLVTVCVLVPSGNANRARSCVTNVRPLPLALSARLGREDWGIPAARLYLAWRVLLSQPTRTWSDMLHSLRLWGRVRSGISKQHETMMEALLDASQAKKQLGGVVVHRPSRYGLEFEPWNQIARQGEIHPNQTLAVMAELGLERDRLIQFQKASYTVQDVVHAAVTNFIWEDELEWTTISLALYLPPAGCWVDKYGRVSDFDRLCTTLCSKPLGTGSCFGTHTLYAIATLLAADKQEPVLSPASQSLARQRLAQAIEQLAQVQRADGHWPIRWYPTSAGSEALAAVSAEDATYDLVVTGHSLEWLALVPEDIRVNDTMIERALLYVVSCIIEAPPARLQSRYCPYTHAGNALKLWCPLAWQQFQRSPAVSHEIPSGK